MPAIAAIEQQPTTNNLQPITEMEVYHHPQLEHKSKPWKNSYIQYMQKSIRF